MTDLLKLRIGPVARSLFVLLFVAGCDSTDPGGTGGQGGGSGYGSGAQGGAAGYASISRDRDIYEIGRINAPGFFGGSSTGGEAGTAGSGSGGLPPSCMLTGPTGSPPTAAVCGDGLLSASEQCDDQNLTGDDACSAACVVTPQVVAPHGESNFPLPLSGRDLGHGPHPTAVGCNRVGVTFLDHASSPAALKLASYSRFGAAQPVVGYGSSRVDAPNPSIAALDSDFFVAVWTDFDDDELGVRLRKVNPQAMTPTPAAFANRGQAFSQRSPDVVFDGSQIVVAWVDDGDPVNGPDVRYRTFSSDLKPTSDDLTLAATSAVEDHVVLAAKGGSWAAAWRSGSAGRETIEIQSGSAHWSVGPFLPGVAQDNPALAFVDPTHLVLAFTAGSDPTLSGVANTPRLHGAVLDTAYVGRVESFSIEPKLAPYSSSPQLSQHEPSIATFADRLVIAWRGSGILGSPAGDELWAREIKWRAGSGNTLFVDTGSPEQSLLTSGDFRGGDQRRPILLNSSYWPEHRLISVWEDSNRSFGSGSSGLPDVGVQFARPPNQLVATPAAGPCVTTTLSPSPSALGVPPAPVTLTASSNCGGAASAEYQIYYMAPGATTLTMIRNWGPPIMTWDTTSLPSGRYVVWAYARRVGASVAFDSYAGVNYLVGHVCSVNPTISVTPTGAQPIGTALTLSGAVTCNGGATPQYRFFYTAPGSTTPVNIGDWSTTPVTWNTAGLPSGSYAIYANLRALGNASDYEAFGVTQATLGNSCNAVNSINGSPASPQPAGTDISLSAAASCTSGSTPEFRYSYFAPGGSNWVQIGNWSSGPVTWNTMGLTGGDYTLNAVVRAVGNASSQEASSSRAYKLQPGAGCSAILTTSTPDIAVPGMLVDVSVAANCGSNPKYRFAYANAGSDNYTYLTSWETAATAVWDTTAISGSYDVVVFVRRSTTTGGFDGVNQKTIHVRPKCINAELSISPGAGELLSLSGYAYCYDPKFSYFARPEGSTDARAAIGSPWVTGSVGFDTSTVTPGSYEFKVDAREAGAGDADVSASIVHQVGPGCTVISELGSLTGHPQGIGTPIGVWVDYGCDAGVTPEFAFYYRAPGASEYQLFPGTEWQSAQFATLETTDFVVGGTYDVQVLLRGVGHVGTKEALSIGSFQIEDP